MSDYHNVEDVKFMVNCNLVKKRFKQQVYELFKTAKNILYISQVLTDEYSIILNIKPCTDEHKAYKIFVNDLHSRVSKYAQTNVPDRAYFDDADIWAAVRALNYQFINSAKSQIKTASTYKESKSYLQKAVEVNYLFPKGFEGLNKGVKFGRNTNNNQDAAWDEGDANMTAEETTGEYYGYDSVTSEVAIKLRKKLEKRPSKLKVNGTPFMINVQKRINRRWTPAKAADLQERGIQQPVNMEDTYELESNAYSRNLLDRGIRNPFQKR
jgi:hypothetical protein